MYLNYILLSALCVSGIADSARILAAVSVASFSHQNAFRPLWKELSRRGHQVTLITTDPIRDASLTNLTEIDISSAYNVMKKFRYNERVLEIGSNIFALINLYMEMNDEMNAELLTHPDIQNLIHNDSIEFDLFIGEYLMPAYFPFIEKFDIPFIGVVSLDSSYLGHDCFGNPSHPVTNPDAMYPFQANLNFEQRISSTIMAILYRAINFYVSQYSGKFIEKYYGHGYSHVLELFCKADMLFLNVNPIFDNIRPIVPAVIHIGGGLHLEHPKPLPKELKEYLDSSKRGVIYFSLGGTNVQSKMLPSELVDTIKETLAELPFDVLWKFEDDEMTNQPKNVKLIKWAPQQDLLRHPNIKLFITQGGLQSLEEAIFSYVPVVGIPIFADQKANMNKVVNKGIGLEIDKDSLDKESFKRAIMEVINNPEYVEKAKKLVELTKDQPMSGLEKAVWWTEYVIRHKGAQHLKGPAAELPFYQYYLLDVIGFFVVIFSIIIFATVKITKGFCRLARKIISVSGTKIKMS